ECPDCPKLPGNRRRASRRWIRIVHFHGWNIPATRSAVDPRPDLRHQNLVRTIGDDPAGCSPDWPGCPDRRYRDVPMDGLRDFFPSYDIESDPIPAPIVSCNTSAAYASRATPLPGIPETLQAW